MFVLFQTALTNTELGDDSNAELKLHLLLCEVEFLSACCIKQSECVTAVWYAELM